MISVYLSLILSLWGIFVSSCSNQSNLQMETQKTIELKPNPIINMEIQQNEENLTPSDLSLSKKLHSGNPLPNVLNNINNDLFAKVLYCRGFGSYFRAGEDSRKLQTDDVLFSGDWIQTKTSSEIELDLESLNISSLVLRLGSLTYLYLEQSLFPNLPELTIILLSGQLGIFMPISDYKIQVITPSGTFQTTGGHFFITVGPLGHTLITTREGTALTTGFMNASITPSNALFLDPSGQSRFYSYNPEETLIFQSRWHTVLMEEALQEFQKNSHNLVQQWKLLEAQFNRFNANQQSLKELIKLQLFEHEKELTWLSIVEDWQNNFLPKDYPSKLNLQKLWKISSRIRLSLVQNNSPWVQSILYSHPLDMFKNSN